MKPTWEGPYFRVRSHDDNGDRVFPLAVVDQLHIDLVTVKR